MHEAVGQPRVTCALGCACCSPAAAVALPPSHSLESYLFSLQINICNGIIMIPEQGKTDTLLGPPPLPRPAFRKECQLTNTLRATLLLEPQLSLPPVFSQVALPTVLPLHVCSLWSPALPAFSSAGTLWVEPDTNTCHHGKCLCHLPFVWGLQGAMGTEPTPPHLFFYHAWRNMVLRWADKMRHVLAWPLTACLAEASKGLHTGRAGRQGGLLNRAAGGRKADKSCLSAEGAKPLDPQARIQRTG